jgi:putative phosphoesterase
MPRGKRMLPEGCVQVLRTASLILHVGDLTSRQMLDELAGYAAVEAVHGNMDEPQLAALLPERRVVETADGLRIDVVHDPGARPGRHERLVGWFPGCDVVAYGHTHAPEVTRHRGVWIVNPGSPTERRRSPSHSLAVIREEVPELVLLD